MPKKTSRPVEGQSPSTAGGPAEIHRQMEELRNQLMLLASHAEGELELLLQKNPEPVVSMLETFASKIDSKAGTFCIDLQNRHFTSFQALESIPLLEEDHFQCDLALSGREMAMDFSRGRVYLPVVVFENPFAVAVFTVQGLNAGTYEIVCKAAREGIGKLRRDVRLAHATGTPEVAAS